MLDQPTSTVDVDDGFGQSALIGIALILVAINLLVWRSSLDGAFQFDDYGNILNKQNIDQLWPPTAFLDSSRPIGLFSLAVNRRVSGESTYGYHLFNLAVHSINALLIYTGILLSRRAWMQSRGQQTALSFFWVSVAAISALFWAIHPLTTQAVTYIVQRYESLSAIGYLGVWVGLLIVIVSRDRKLRFCAYLLILVLSWIGLMSKEVFATAPLAVLLFDRQVSGQTFRRILSRRWLAYTLMLSPFAWFAPSVSRWLDPTRSTSMGLGMKEINSWEYLRTQPEVILYYLKLSIWPDPLCIDYVWRIQQQPAIYLSLGAIILSIIAIGVWGYINGLPSVSAMNSAPNALPDDSDDQTSRPGRWWGFAGWGVLTFFFILAPTSSVMPIADLAFEHRMYLPLALVVTAVVFPAAFSARRLWNQSSNHFVLAVGFCLTALSVGGMLGWRTHLRNLQYRDELIIWMGVTEVAPKNPRGWYHVGSQLYKRGRPEAALPYMISAVGYGGERNPPLYDVGLGDCLRHLGRVDEALFFYRRAIKNNPEYGEGHNNLGVAYSDQGNDKMSLRHFQIASDLGHIEAMHNMAMVYERQGRHELAVRWLQNANFAAISRDRTDLIEQIERRLLSNQKVIGSKETEAGQP